MARCSAAAPDAPELRASRSAQLVWRAKPRPRLEPKLDLAPAAVSSKEPGADTRAVQQPGAMLEVPSACASAVWEQPAKQVGCRSLKAGAQGTWVGAPLFGALAPPALARFCRYVWHPAADAPPNFEALRDGLEPHGVAAPALDCPVVRPLSDHAPVAASLWKPMRERHARVADGLPAGVGARATTRVAVLDTAAVPYDRTDDLDNAGHGRAVGRTIEALACGPEQSAACAVEVSNHLALPQTGPTWAARDHVHGGYYGTRGDLALAIYEALRSFGTDRQRGATEADNLVLNLSVGWEGGAAGPPDAPDALGAAARAVFQALARASCLGVPVIAANGNLRGDSRQGALWPAAWEVYDAPGEAACVGLTGAPFDHVFSAAPPYVTADAYHPLLQAVGATDAADALLATQRTAALPRLLAPGMQAVQSDVRTGHTEILSGSSVAAAVVSAAVARSWAQFPAFGAQQVVEHVYDKAVAPAASAPPFRPAELAWGGRPMSARRVSVCQSAREAACMGGACRSFPACQPPRPFEGASVPRAKGTPRGWGPSLPALVCREPRCGRRWPPGDAGPWVGPQPPPAGCDVCMMSPERSTVYLQLTERSRAAARAIRLELDGAAYLVERPSAGYPTRLQIPVPGATLTRGTVTFELAAGGQRAVTTQPLSAR